MNVIVIITEITKFKYYIKKFQADTTNLMFLSMFIVEVPTVIVSITRYNNQFNCLSKQK